MRKLLVGAALFAAGTLLGSPSFAAGNQTAQAQAQQIIGTATATAVGELKTAEQEKLIKEAVEAVVQTHEVIRLLEEGKTKEALELLQRLKERMDMLVEKYNLYRVPVDVTFIEFSGVSDLEQALRLNAAVKQVVAANDFVTARQLLQVLRNEIDVQTTYMPLALYKQAVDFALELLKRGKVEAAKYALETALGTLEIETVIFPKPMLEAEFLVREAEKIYEQDPEAAMRLLERAIYDVKLTVALGYLPSEEAAKPLLDKIQQLIEAIKAKKEGVAEQFKGVKEEMKKLGEKATHHR